MATGRGHAAILDRLLDHSFHSRRIDRDTFVPITSNLQQSALGRDVQADALRDPKNPVPAGLPE
jgi:hypothetical protein